MSVKSCSVPKIIVTPSQLLLKCRPMQVNFGTVPFEAAERSMRLFGDKVIPHFAAG